MVDYKKLYTWLFIQVDQALTLMDTGDLLQYDRAKEILLNALQTAEDMYVADMQDE